MKMCLIAHQTVVWQVWISQLISHEIGGKILVVPLCPDQSHMHNFAVCIGGYSGHYAGCTVQSHQTCLMLDRAYMQIALDCGQWTQILGQWLRLCKLRNDNQVAFYMWHSLLHTIAFPISGLHLEIGFLLIKFTVKSVPRHCYGPHLNKEFHSITPQRSISTNFKGHCFSSNTCT
jgi:hypothetical protein